MQVNGIGAAGLDANGRVASGELGRFVTRYVYDGLGRLIRKETPVSAVSTYMQAKDYYYDGVRRIQEVIARPQELLPELPPLGGGVQNDELPMLLDGGGLLDPNDEDPEPIPPEVQYQRWIDREYVYGPAYVDEFVCQIDRYGGVIYMVQDANYNVVALVSGGCCLSVPEGNCVQPPAGAILEQYTYEPCGGIVAEELFFDHAVNRVGFQGLFFERFDGAFTDLTITSANEGLYYARNRFYDVDRGRFNQRDVNGTALPIITAMLMNGKMPEVLMRGFDARELYRDSRNLYECLGSNPLVRVDPMGTWIFSLAFFGGATLGAAAYADTHGLQGNAAINGAMYTFVLNAAATVVVGKAEDWVAKKWATMAWEDTISGIAGGLGFFLSFEAGMHFGMIEAAIWCYETGFN